MSGILLDTHALLWWLEGSERLTKRVSENILDPANDVYVSAASVWEIATKYRVGKLQNVKTFVRDPHAIIRGEGFEHLPISAAHANQAGLFDVAHRDPFDRMLAAQALLEDMLLISADPQLRHFGANVFWI